MSYRKRVTLIFVLLAAVAILTYFFFNNTLLETIRSLKPNYKDDTGGISIEKLPELDDLKYKNTLNDGSHNANYAPEEIVEEVLIPERERTRPVSARKVEIKPNDDETKPRGPTQNSDERLKINITRKAQWQVVNEPIAAMFYSAFYDDRPTLKSGPTIRVLGIAECKEKDWTHWITFKCQIWFDDKQLQSVTVSANLIPMGAGNPHFKTQKFFREYSFSCEVPTYNGQQRVPKFVSILLGSSIEPKTKLPVTIPKRYDQKELLGVCVSVTYWNHDPFRLIEWFEMQKILGVSHIDIYNNSQTDNTAKIFKHYADDKFVTYRQIWNPLIGSKDDELIIILTGAVALNDCFYRNMYRFKYIGVWDLDEFITPRSTDNFNDMLNLLNMTYHKTSYRFRNAYFFLDSPGLKNISDHLVTQKYPIRLTENGPDYSVKSIYEPMYCTVVHNHVCWASLPGFEEADVDPKFGLNQHYKKCHYGEPFCSTVLQTAFEDKTMFRFYDKLKINVAQKLKDIGIEGK